MLNNQRVYIYVIVVVVAVVDEDEDKEENDDSNEYSDDAEEEEEEDMTLLYFVISRLHFSVMFVVFFPLYYCVIFFSVSYIYALLLSLPISVHGTQNETLRPSTQKERAHVLEWCCN